MARGTMTTKGQITIPKQVRDELGLRPGTEVEFSRAADGEFRLRVAGPGHVLADLMNSINYDGPPISIEGMEQAIADSAAERER